MLMITVPRVNGFAGNAVHKKVGPVKVLSL